MGQGAQSPPATLNQVTPRGCLSGWHRDLLWVSSLFTQVSLPPAPPTSKRFPDNPLPFLPQTQWKVNWMFYAFEISKKWKGGRFQPYFNNTCINFYLLLTFVLISLNALSGSFLICLALLGWWWRLTSNAKRLTLFPFIEQLRIVWCLHHERAPGQTGRVTRVYYKSAGNNSNYFTLKDIKIAPQLPSGIQKLLWVLKKKKMGGMHLVWLGSLF